MDSGSKSTPTDHWLADRSLQRWNQIASGMLETPACSVLWQGVSPLLMATNRYLTPQTARAAHQEFDAALKRQADGVPSNHDVIAATLITIFGRKARDEEVLEDEHEYMTQSVFDRRRVQCHPAQNCSSGGCGREGCWTCRSLFKYAEPKFFGYKLRKFRAAQRRQRQAAPLVIASTTRVFNITDKLDGRFNTILPMHMMPTQLR